MAAPSTVSIPAPTSQPRPPSSAVTSPASSSSSSSSSSSGYSTIGYYSNGEEGSSITTTIWAPQLVSTGPTWYSISSSNWWRNCAYVVSYSSTTVAENPATTQRSVLTTYLTSSGTYSCPIWTDCQGGTLSGPGAATSFCQMGSYRCMTFVLYNSYGGMPSQTSFGCSSATSGAPLETRLYVNKPAATGLTKPFSASQTSSSPIKSETSNPPSPPPAKDNTGAIAGGVVGGLAVLAIAGVAIFWILRRGRRKDKDEPDNAAADMSYDAYKQSPQGPLGYYEPGLAGQKAELATDQERPIYEAPANEIPANAQNSSASPLSQAPELPAPPVPR